MPTQLRDDDQQMTPGDMQPRRRDSRFAAGWFGGAVLIILGGLFLLRNFGVSITGNWWAFFILIPAITSWGTAVSLYRAAGNRFTPAVAGAISGGLFLATIAAIFLFNLNWGRLWPVFIIIAGISALLQWSANSTRSRYE